MPRDMNEAFATLVARISALMVLHPELRAETCCVRIVKNYPEIVVGIERFASSLQIHGALEKAKAGT